MAAPAPAELRLAPSRRRIHAEVAIVLALSLGQSAIYSIVSLANRLTLEQPLSQQVTTLNPSRSTREVFDLIYQLLSIGFALVPVVLVAFLLWRSRRPHLGDLGLPGDRVGRDVLHGVALLAVIGLPGIGIYLAGRALGIGVVVDPSGLSDYWWTIPVLILSAARAALQEELIMLGYLFHRLAQAGWSRWTLIVSAAVLRGSYHLYQGFGAFIANFLMGMLFGWLYSRTKRVLPFLVVHFLIDAIVFVGYPLVAGTWPELFGLPAS